MPAASTSASPDEQGLPARARAGEQDAFAQFLPRTPTPSRRRACAHGTSTIAFIARFTEPRGRDVFERYPYEPVHAGKLADVFERFALPVRLGS